jgi:tetratricopeptide (TPR) repeat protein
MQRNISFGAILCAFAFTAVSPSFSAAESKAPADAKAGDACKQGRAQYASGDVLKAVKTLGRCLEREPRNREAWIALANANLEAGRFQPATEAFAKAESIKPGDEAFLAGYLSALEGAGMAEERIPVLRAMAGKRRADRKAAENLLAAVEASGPDKHPEEYLAALQMITETPGADKYQVGKLAAAYLKRGQMEKAEAEYRGLLVREPESSDNWAGLGAALAASDAQAAAECYRKAAFYSNQADHRVAYQKEQQRLSTGPAAKPQGKAPLADDSKDNALLAAVAPPASEPAKPASAPAKPEAAKPAAPAAQPVKPEAAPAIAAASKPAPEAKPKPFDVKAYQDSVYKAELAKRLAVLHAEKAASAPASAPAAAKSIAVAPIASAPATGSGSPSAKDAEKKAKEDKLKQEELARKQAEAEKERLAKEAKAKQEALAKAEKVRQDSLALVAEQRAKEEKAKQESLSKAEKARQDSVARVAELKAKEDKAKQEAFSKAEKARQDSVARVAEIKSKEDKARQEAMAKVEKARQDSVAHVAEMKVKSDKARQDSLARVAEQKVKEDKAKQEAMAKAEKARQDSVARVAEMKIKEDKAKQEAMAKAEKARQDSVARVAEQKAKEEKARLEALAKAEKTRLDSVARVAELKVKEEKAKQEALAKAEKARQDSVARVAEMKAKAEKAHQDSVARVAEQKAKEEKARQEALAKVEKARQDSVARAVELKTKAEKVARERRERYDRAFGYYRDGKLDSSLMAFKPVLADSPFADAWYYAGRAHLAKGEHAKALDHFEKAPQDKPDLDGLKGKAYMGLGKHKEALKAMESQYAKSGNDSLLEDLAALKRKNGDEAGAIVYLEKLAEKHPGMEKIQEQLAAYYRAKGDKAKATEKYSRVFIVNTGNAEANYWLGMEAANSGDAARAVPFLEKAVTLVPNRADAWKALAKADAALGRKDAAWEAYKKAFALSPADAEIARNKLALARESRPADLIKCYEDVLRLAPSDADAAMGLAMARYEQGDWIAAEKNFRIACKDSKDAHAWALFGRTLLELKKTEEASVTLQKAIDFGDKDPALRLDLARIRMEKGDLDWAEALVKDLSKKSPADPEPLYFLGQIALKRQQSAVAEEFFRKSHQLKPDDGKYAEALARLYKDKDNWKDAVSVLAQAESKLTASGRLLYGDCLARGGDPVKAQAVYAELYKKEPSAPLLSRRMDLQVRLGKADQAVELAGAAGGAGYKEATEVRFSLAKAQLALADEHVLKGDVDMAVDLMKKVLKTDDHRPEYHYYLGLGYLDQNKPKKALDEFVDALTYRVDYPEALYRKGLCLIRTEDVKDAENAFGELSQHAEPIWKARGLYGLAMVFEAQGKPEAVQHHLERSVSAYPLPDALAYLSRVTLKQAKASEAQEMARKALTLDPAHEGATVAMAEALSGAKKQSEAMELARQGLRAKPLSCGLLVQSAKLNFEAGKLDSTLAAGATAIRICPEEPMGYYYAGVATQGSNRPKEAKQYFKSFKKYGGDKKLVPEN